MASFGQTSKTFFSAIKMLFLSKIIVFHILYCFKDHTTKKKIRHTRRHKLQPNYRVAFSRLENRRVRRVPASTGVYGECRRVPASTGGYQRVPSSTASTGEYRRVWRVPASTGEYGEYRRVRRIPVNTGEYRRVSASTGEYGEYRRVPAIMASAIEYLRDWSFNVI